MLEKGDEIWIGLGDIEKNCDLRYCKNNCNNDIYCNFDISYAIYIKCDGDIKHNREILSSITNDISSM